MLVILESSYIIGGSTATLGKGLAVTYEAKYTFYPAIPSLCIYPKGMRAHFHKKTCTEGSLQLIHNSLNLERAQTPTNSRMDNQMEIIVLQNTTHQ